MRLGRRQSASAAWMRQKLRHSMNRKEFLSSLAGVWAAQVFTNAGVGRLALIGSSDLIGR
jgi:hypothetical protein